MDEYLDDQKKFLLNLCELHHDKITGFEFAELVKEFCGYSSCGNYFHDGLIDRGIDPNDY